MVVLHGQITEIYLICEACVGKGSIIEKIKYLDLKDGYQNRDFGFNFSFVKVEHLGSPENFNFDKPPEWLPFTKARIWNWRTICAYALVYRLASFHCILLVGHVPYRF